MARKVNGLHLEKMLRNGLANLRLHEEEINSLNVFPVADGDTGTNLYLTLENGLRCAKTASEAGVFLRGLSEGMLLGARGNSGVILSQFFRGFAQELSRCAWLGPGEWRNGLIRAYRTAYSAVVQPVEGTILTVVREGIEHIRTQITRNTTVEALLSMYIAEMRKTLAFTPEMLPVLKEAGVVDSGALGFIVIVEGMLKYLYGEILKGEDRPRTAAAAANFAPNLDLFNETSIFEDGYCLEFILQLMQGPKYDQRFRVASYIEDLKLFGNSIVAAQDGKRVKVHIHTFHPAKVIAASQEFGEFLTFKLENMQIQHNEQIQKKQETGGHKPLSVISVVNGSGMAELFSTLGSDCVIDGGATMNTSSQEFLDAFSGISADRIVILPNNPNVVLAAQQAVKLSGREDITVIPSASFAQGYFALAMDISYDEDTNARVAAMQSGIEDVATLSETTASRDYSYHEIRCKKGDPIALLDNEIVCVGSDPIKTVIEGFSHVPEIAEKETCVVFLGEGVDETQREALEEALAEAYPALEAEFIEGGQKIYHFVIGII